MQTRARILGKLPMRAALNMMLLIVLLAGLIAPRVTAIIADVLPGVQTMVICTGEGLIILRIGPDGQPIEETEQAFNHCVLSDGTVVAQQAVPHWQMLAADYTDGFAVHENTAAEAAPLARPRLTRGPPVLI